MSGLSTTRSTSPAGWSTSRELLRRISASTPERSSDCDQAARYRTAGRAGVPCPPCGACLEGAGAVRGAQPRRGVIALLGHAQVVVAARGAMPAVEPVVVSLADIEQRAGMGVLETR